MDRLANWIPGLPFVDLLAIALVLVGAVLGLARGLGPVFGMFLWLVVALWLGKVVAPVILGWMPNTNDPGAEFAAYGVITTVVLCLPLLARILGGSTGRKKKDPMARYKPFGVLLGIVGALLVFTLFVPHARRVGLVARGYQDARSPTVAAEIAGALTWLFPESHRRALVQAMTTPPPEPEPDAAANR